MGYLDSVYLDLAHCGSKNLCCRTDNVFFCISEVSHGTVSLREIGIPVTGDWNFGIRLLVD